jgi:hypothetical protein
VIRRKDEHYRICKLEFNGQINLCVVLELFMPVEGQNASRGKI